MHETGIVGRGALQYGQSQTQQKSASQTHQLCHPFRIPGKETESFFAAWLYQKLSALYMKDTADQGGSTSLAVSQAVKSLVYPRNIAAYTLTHWTFLHTQ